MAKEALGRERGRSKKSVFSAKWGALYGEIEIEFSLSGRLPLGIRGHIRIWDQA